MATTTTSKHFLKISMNLQPISTNEISLKIILLGDSTVGKSSLLSRLLNENPPEYYNATIGVDLKVLHIPSLLGNVKLQLWDFGAQGERFRETDKPSIISINGMKLLKNKTKEKTFVVC